MAASNLQVQQFVDQRTRVLCEAIRNLLVACQDYKAMDTDIYNAVTVSPTWTDTRTDVPHALSRSEVAAVSDFAAKAVTWFGQQNELPIVRLGCVRAVNS